METLQGKPPYFYAPHGNGWGVWSEDGYHYDDFLSRQEAREAVYRLNGWKLKK